MGKGILRPSWNAAVFLPERRTNSSLMRRNEHEHDQKAEGGRGELTYGPRFCRQLLRRPCTGWHQRVLCRRCDGQVDRRDGVWVRVSPSTKCADEGGVLHLVRADCKRRDERVRKNIVTYAFK